MSKLSKIYDLSLVAHWDDGKDSWLGVNDIDKSTLKAIIKDLNQIWEGFIHKENFDLGGDKNE
jgi:hypothetical protein